MSSSGGIHGHLLKLHQSLSDEDQRAAALKSHDIVGDLAQECLETTTDNKLGEMSVNTDGPALLLRIQQERNCFFNVKNFLKRNKTHARAVLFW